MQDPSDKYVGPSNRKPRSSDGPIAQYVGHDFGSLGHVSLWVHGLVGTPLARLGLKILRKSGCIFTLVS